MFAIIRLEEDRNIFFIVKKDILNGSFFKGPFPVYGFLRVDGSNYLNSTVAYRNIADELAGNEELEKLADQAKMAFWNID